MRIGLSFFWHKLRVKILRSSLPPVVRSWHLYPLVVVLLQLMRLQLVAEVVQLLRLRLSPRKKRKWRRMRNMMMIWVSVSLTNSL
ncbi:60S acidic ribosomal protein p2 [Phtheirospermum japonicum]|uniref:60S acidic ribosomal protein p2 n=1 Tax=Phtheirospermum japonicum TaxID=374723 RepID=A0A830BNX3_9LAMI|nr:60S acidic ribosomal protein p2 [Phtheirospermum japonicum]